MKKIIKYGFQPINNNRLHGQNSQKGEKLYKSGHVHDVIECNSDGLIIITAKVVAETSVSKIYNIKITLDDSRKVSHAECNYKAGLAGRCKHMCAVIYYVNSPETALSKTSFSQEWGKPTQRQLLGYDKGERMSKLFTPRALYPEASQLKPIKITSANLPTSFANTPLKKMLELEERSNIEVTAAESLLEMIQRNEKLTVEEKAKKVVLDILKLQPANNIYSQKIVIIKDLFTFYQKIVCCNIDSALNISLMTINQSKSSEWFKQRALRITASNGHRLKGNRFNVEKVLSDFLSPNKTEIASMTYGKKTENTALKEYPKSVDPTYDIVKVGLIVNLQQPWLCCSPDTILVYGKEFWQMRLIEIKCPYNCRKVPVYDQESREANVAYLKVDENGLQLSTTHTIFIQVQFQMYVTNIAFCNLFIYSPHGSVLITIRRDDQLLSQLIPTLERFYFSHYLQKLYTKYNTE